MISFGPESHMYLDGNILQYISNQEDIAPQEVDSEALTALARHAGQMEPLR